MKNIQTSFDSEQELNLIIPRLWFSRLIVILWAAARFHCLAAVINEIHHSPVPANDPVEFVELFNPGSEPIAMEGWRLEGAVDYLFLPGTTLPSAGFLVVAANPAAIQKRFAAPALGPWTGRLSAQRERVALRDASGRIVDEVGYQLGFPWPTVGDAPGYSIELIHPRLDNNLGGSWRQSLAANSPTASDQVLFPSGSIWRMLPGQTEASSPVSAWRLARFDDTAWSEAALPVGYGETFIATPLPNMRNNYTCVFLRKTFVVADPVAVESLVLETQFDDGFNVWINGTHVASQNVPSREVPFTGTAVSALESFDFQPQTFPLPTNYLVHGTNIIAVQAFNSSIGSSSDFFFDARLKSSTAAANQGPTPGRSNAAFAAAAGPQLRQVDHSPRQPRSGEPVLITTKVTAESGVSSVSLEYQVVHPGSYIELADTAYATSWIPLPMNDSGTAGDLIAKDSIYTTILPASVQSNRRLVRYRITASDGSNRAVLAPYPDDPSPNFAYFVYDGVPSWRGSIRPGTAPILEYPAEEMSRLATYHLISKKTSVERSIWTEKYTGDLYKWRGTLIYDGEVYDHIGYRARGGVWRYAMGKNMWKFDFNRGHDFLARDSFGNRYSAGWTKLNLGACIQQGDYDHRGEHGMFEAVGFRLFNLAGAESPLTHWVQFRVIDDLEEAPSTSQFTGDFWGVYLAVEQEDGRFLREHNLPDGNLYKMESGSGELNNLGDAGVADKSDLNLFLNTYRNTTPSESWWRTNFDLDRYYSYQTIVQAIHHYDICYGKNYFYYLNPESNRWSVLSWDLDLTWADNMYDAGCGGRDDFRVKITSHPIFGIEYRNRAREFRDLLFNQDQAYRVIDEHAGILRGTRSGPTLLDADRAMWDYNPLMNNSSIVNLSKAGFGRFYQFPRESSTNSSLRGSFDAAIRIMKNYVIRRGAFLDAEARDLDIPSRPSIFSLAPESFPINRLAFSVAAYAGRNAFKSIEWRLAEVTPTNLPAFNPIAPQRYEIETRWSSGPLASFQNHIQLPPSALRVGSNYRVRARMTDVTGRASQWSLPIEFVAGPPDNHALLRDHLRITELMYAPADGGAGEFIELRNTSPDHALDLSGVSATSGISFSFASGDTLPPGATALLVKTSALDNFASFRQLYSLPATTRLFGPYSGSLADEGESIVFRAGTGGAKLIDFNYGDGRAWPVATDGAGHSLVPRSRSIPPQDDGQLSHPYQWSASTHLRGSPGADDPVSKTPVLLSEIASSSSSASNPNAYAWIELHNPSNADFTFLDHWFLSDDALNLKKWPIMPGMTIAAGQMLVLSQTNGLVLPAGSSFSLNAAGFVVFLSQFPENTPARVVDSARFKAHELGKSFGRYPDGSDSWFYLPRQTPGSANPAPVEEVYLSEVHYHPAPSTLLGSDSDSFEFIELHNVSTRTINLWEPAGSWRLTGEVDFEFPPGSKLAPGEIMVVTSFNPTNSAMADAFRARFRANTPMLWLGGYVGQLDNRAGRLTLEKPLLLGPSGTPPAWVVIDELVYHDASPWPAEADGTGASLHRRDGSANAFDASRWFTATPSPGVKLATIPSVDTDRDGMSDDWERIMDLDPALAADANLDPDSDGKTNLEEFQSATHPKDPGSVLRFSNTRVHEGQLRLEFRAEAGIYYRIQRRSSLDAISAWTDIASFEPGPIPQARSWQGVLGGNRASDYYRLIAGSPSR